MISAFSFNSLVTHPLVRDLVFIIIRSLINKGGIINFAGYLNLQSIRSLESNLFWMSRLMIIFFIIGVRAPIFAQVDSTRTIELDNIIIQGNRIDIPFRETSRNIGVMTDLEIKDLPVQSIPEILSYIPGVDIRQRGPVGVQADIGIRGGTFEQTLVLLNGLKL